MIQIDQTLLPESLLVVDESGKKTLDVTKIKTQQDVDKVLLAKQHANEELSALKTKYSNIDVDRYNNLIAKELEQNKDILNNSVYKHLEGQFSSLQQENQKLQAEIQRRDQLIVDSELKQEIRKFKGIQPAAVDDILTHAKLAGYSKTEKGFLSTEGNNLESFMAKLQTEKPYLFKRTVGLRDEEKFKNREEARKNNNIQDVLANLQTIN